MAIQNRRGAYADFDPAKLKPGEFAIVQSGDTTSSDGRAIYVCTSPGVVKRLASLDELESYNQEAQEAAETAQAKAKDAGEVYLQADRAKQAAETAAQEAAQKLAQLDPKVQAAITAITGQGQTTADQIGDLKENALQAIEKAKGDASEALADERADALNNLDIKQREAVDIIDKKTAIIQQLTFNSDQMASEALSTANNLSNDVAEALNVLDNVKSNQSAMELVVEGKIDGAYVENGYLILTSNGEAVSDPIGPFAGGGGGGGGGAVNGAQLTVTNTNGWLSKTIANGDTCPICLNWSSIEDGNATGDGTLKVTVNGVVKAVVNAAQGPIELDVSKYLAAGSNVVKMNITDVYDNNRTFNFSITVVKISLSSPFDSSAPFTGAIQFPFVPEGQATKIVHFILDNRELDTMVTPVSGRQMSYTIPAQTHGPHTLRVYFTCELNGAEVRSNELYYELICLQNLNLTPIVTSDYSQKEANQYTTLRVGYQVYDPSTLTAEVALKANGQTVQTLTVDRTRQTWAYRADKVGSLKLSIESGGASKELTVTIKEVKVDIQAETEGLELYLSSYGRSNGETAPGTWESGSVSAEFSNFNFVNDGWQLDEAGVSVLRITGDARLSIPFQIFAEDFRTNGRTIEFDFATRDVRDYDASIISCLSGNRGLSITAQEATLRSAQSVISKPYKDDEHLRIAFVVEKRSETRLIHIYIDGTDEGVVRYPDTDDFSQATPVGISIGSNDCTVDLYTIRVYDHNLTKIQVLNNWIMDTQDGVLMLERYNRNDIYDEYGQIVVDKLPKDLPYMIIQTPELPQQKGDKKTIEGTYTDPTNGAKSFSFAGAQADVQGTSSQYYARKNYKIKFNNGFLTVSGQLSAYAMNASAVPTKTFTFKADVASSEGCNNTELVRLYNEACPYKTPPQVENSKIRQGIDGFPIVIFHNDGDRTQFLGKYNFNNDKGTEEVFGFGTGDESWETLNNTSDRCLFKSWASTSWADDFEGRYPDASQEVSNLQSFIQTVSSWTNPTKAQIEAIAEKDSAIFYFIFTELFLMVDSRAKNAFPTRFSGGKWCWLPYDFDTAIGINNEGQYVFNYNLETGDKIGNDNVFNGEGHRFWEAVKNAYPGEIASMYELLRNSGALSFAKTRQMFDDHQAKWPEAIFNEDSQYKYLDPLIVDNDAAYLTMLQGTKRSVRNWWLYHRFQYLDSKWNCADNRNEVITVRGYAKANLSVTPYADLYCNIKYGSALVQKRGVRNTSYTLNCPLDNVNDTETYIYGANMIKKIEGLPAYQVGYANFARGLKLQEIVLGSNVGGYTNERLTELHLGDLKLLKLLDCRNCVNLGTGTMATIDASGCMNIEEIYMDNTKITGIDLPNGGQLRKLHLPSTVTNLTIRNQKKIEELSMPSYSNISTLVLENVSSVIKPLELLDQIDSNARLRLIGFDLGTITSAQLKSFMAKLDSFRGLDDQGNTVSTAQVSGTCHISQVTGADMAEFKQRYPYIKVTYDHLTAYIKYYSEDGSELLHTETVVDGADATWNGTVNKPQTAQYTYAFDGWASTINGPLWANAQKNVSEDRNVYAHFKATVRTYTVYFYNGSMLLQTVQNVPYGGSASYTAGSTSNITNSSGDPFTGWNPEPKNIVGNTSCYAQFVPMYTCTFKNGTEILYTARVRQGTTVTYAGPDLTNVTDADGNPWCGWDKALTNITTNTTFNAVFYSFNETITDSWETIISKINNASTGADCGYSLGDIKVLDFGGDFGKVGMQLVAFDMDDLADGTGKAKTTWLTKELGAAGKRMNPYVEELYGFKNQSSWSSASGSTTSSKSLTSQNRYPDGAEETTAHTVYTIKSAIDQDVLIGWKTNAAATYGLLNVAIDGEKVATDFASTTEQTTTLNLVAEQIVTIDVTYKRTTSGPTSSYYATLRVAPQGGSITYTSAIDQCPIRYTVGYKEGTGASGGWPKTEMFTYVTSLKANLPAALQSAIKTVTKTQPAYQATSTSSYVQTTQDDLWIPSYNEMFSTSARQVRYTGFFTSNESRKKFKVGAAGASWWWLRSAGNGNSFLSVYSDGSYSGSSADYTGGVAVGFCI